MKTKNNPNQRQENIIHYLNTHSEATTEEIQKLFSIAKSTLSEDIKFLRSKGYPIVTRYRYISLEKQQDSSIIPYYEKFCPAIIRKWIILYAINIFFHPEANPPNLPSLYEKCDYIYSMVSHSKKPMSKQVFFKDINELIKDRYLDYTPNTKESLSKNKCLKYNERDIIPTEKTPKVVVLDQPTAYSLFHFLENELGSTLFSDLKNRLLKHWPRIKPTLTYSKDNFYTSPLPNMLENFMKLPYKTTCIDITCLSTMDSSKNILYKDFETETIIYCIEKSKFYILGIGTSEEFDKKMHFLLPVENITKLQTSTERNTMYQDSYLCKNEVLQLLLSFSNEIQVLSPDEMAENINKKKLKLKKRYEETFEIEYKEHINECLS